MKLSIIIPVLNEAAAIEAALRPLQVLRGPDVEVIVADGASDDATVPLAQLLADRVIAAPRGRARQMNAGAAVATGEVLLFLHADTTLPEAAPRAILQAFMPEEPPVPTVLSSPLGENSSSGAVSVNRGDGVAASVNRGDGVATSPRNCWGRFDVVITGHHPMLRVIARSMNRRSRLTGIATGDQAMFMTRAAFDAVGGFPDQPLMEDIEMSHRLRRLGRPACLDLKVATSGRRWESRGVWRTMFLMWRLRLAYFLGASPATLAARYR